MIGSVWFSLVMRAALISMFSFLLYGQTDFVGWLVLGVVWAVIAVGDALVELI